MLKKRADELLSILFDKTLHNSYFDKLPFGSKEKFAKTTNTILPLVINVVMPASGTFL